MVIRIQLIVIGIIVGNMAIIINFTFNNSKYWANYQQYHYHFSIGPLFKLPMVSEKDILYSVLLYTYIFSDNIGK